MGELDTTDKEFEPLAESRVIIARTGEHAERAGVACQQDGCCALIEVGLDGGEKETMKDIVPCIIVGAMDIES